MCDGFFNSTIDGGEEEDVVGGGVGEVVEDGSDARGSIGDEDKFVGRDVEELGGVFVSGLYRKQRMGSGTGAYF